MNHVLESRLLAASTTMTIANIGIARVLSERGINTPFAEVCTARNIGFDEARTDWVLELLKRPDPQSGDAVLEYMGLWYLKNLSEVPRYIIQAAESGDHSLILEAIRDLKG